MQKLFFYKQDIFSHKKAPHIFLQYRNFFERCLGRIFFSIVRYTIFLGLQEFFSKFSNLFPLSSKIKWNLPPHPLEAFEFLAAFCCYNSYSLLTKTSTVFSVKFQMWIRYAFIQITIIALSITTLPWFILRLQLSHSMIS